MIVIPFETNAEIPNLPQLRDKVQRYGGSIVQYEHLFSIILYFQRSPVFRYVPPGKSHKVAGIPHALFCGLLGWWSPVGWLITPPIVVTNLLGGVEVTKLLMPAPPALPGQAPDTSGQEELMRGQKRHQNVFLAYLGLLLSGVAAMLVWYYWDN